MKFSWNLKANWHPTKAAAPKPISAFRVTGAPLSILSRNNEKTQTYKNQVATGYPATIFFVCRTNTQNDFSSKIFLLFNRLDILFLRLFMKNLF